MCIRDRRIGYNYRMSNICAGIGRGQMTVVDEHIAHHKHLCGLYRKMLADVEGITLHETPSGRYESNYWLNTVLVDGNLHVRGDEMCIRDRVLSVRVALIELQKCGRFLLAFLLIC